ncbi:hypothetical protein [Mesorhizobium sp. M2C.T.Ca.TU.002.02.1.1]|uniref:hypothetical protein n=1 Tax=Mesorhizobium sp. M2C.T.Ca.TU.002.02.1.1 TaxID=2496788 RepID=UPI000FCC2B18|nr:hypothetical protein [Mesorhizobium sp. M2C.T.Ca.TU.002.02.1.1]RUU61382.1 hypothetical protein EOD07_01220 [Mesorhizobium sp. M2C.T.Ca.TU.002.02.1.1]
MASVTARHTMAILMQRLKWPVPMVRWRAAREIRGLLQSDKTRVDMTAELLDFLEFCTTESEVCSVLCLLFLTESKARPSRHDVAARIKCPSILADVLLEKTFGFGAALGGWEVAHSGEAPIFFRPDEYFLNHKGAHIPPTFYNELRKIERSTGLPFRQQWAWEWHNLREKLGASLTSYAHYFDEYGDTRSGVKGQYLQRQTEVFRSAHIRAFAFAVSEWGMPLKLAGNYLVEHIPAIGGIFDLDLSPKPESLGDLPTKAFAEGSDLEGVLAEWVEANRNAEMPAVSFGSPFPLDLARYGDLRVGAYFVSSDFEMRNDHGPFEPMDFTLATESLSIEGAIRDVDIKHMKRDGKAGWCAPVCTSLFPIPYGFWSSDYFALGLRFLAPYCLPKESATRVRAGALELVSGEAVVSRTRIWNDVWTPAYIPEGHTRCGAIAEIEKGVFEALPTRAPKGSKLAWYIETSIWTRETDYGDYAMKKRRALILDDAV